VYGAFLKKLKKSALKKLTLKPVELYKNNQTQQVFNRDSNILLKDITADILYLDPPYNQRQYSTNYHLLATIARYDEPKILGKTGLRSYKQQKSLYCSKSKVKEIFKDLILKAKAKYIFLSYNNEGLMSLKDIKEIMSLKGRYDYVTKNYNRYKADSHRNYKTDKTIEYLHYTVC
ncbi:MAG: DNA adenine methylase, partial [Bdellovibrionaceae bacterium]|nr:DNA adenine methylase [Pseudobdellovibrionaceae bacterium]